MTSNEFATWLEEAIPAYAADKVASGQWSEEASIDLARKQHDELLPLGLQTPDHHFYSIVDSDSRVVGMLWFGVKTQFNSPVAFVFNIQIAPEYRRQGHAFRAFRALETEVQKLGLSGVSLHVFGHNTSAQALYSKLGFQTTNINLFKAVPASDA
jgi:ribosomal protein S18 acetylase RimI-like enzyme